ncbi:unnamed protein product [Plutella xylostella]|uniref:(diamondback moth) hypothetical protein n=1 Tax=Plutella xylostella TaxID=51655 RepID=A0A8S4GFJ3_PLUXY|nr:unnamed protein product [Plutella xylostella]
MTLHFPKPVVTPCRMVTLMPPGSVSASRSTLKGSRGSMPRSGTPRTKPGMAAWSARFRHAGVATGHGWMKSAGN